MNYLKVNSEVTFDSILNIIKLNLKKIIIFVFSFCLLLFAFSFIIPEKYVSEASVLPPKKESAGGLSSFLQNMAGNLAMGGLGKNDEVQLFLEIIQSRTTAEYIIEDLKLKEDDRFKKMKNLELIKLIQKSLEAELPKTGVIKLYCSAYTDFFPFISNQKDDAAKLSKDILNSAVAGLDKIIRERSTSTARKTKEYIQKEIAFYRQKLDTIETNLEKFQKENNVLAIEEQTQAIVGQAVDVGKELALADIDLSIARLQFQENSPRLEAYKKQYEILQQQYQNIQTGGLKSTDIYSFPLERVPHLMKTYIGLMRDRKVLEQVLIYLETQKHQEAIQEKRDVPIVEMLDKPNLPEERESPNRKFMLILGLTLSSISSLLWFVGKAVYKGNIYLKSIEK